MFDIAKRQIQEGLADAKFLFMVVLILISFITNAFVYSSSYEMAMLDWQAAKRAMNAELDSRSDVLQQIVNFAQTMVERPPALAFVADGGESRLPNAIAVNAFKTDPPEFISRGNEMFDTLPALDWVFIIGWLMTLMTFLLSFSVVCGEKSQGTLKLLLSYPVKRMSIVVGKGVGIALVSIFILLLGIFVNLSCIFLLGSIPITMAMLLNIGWIILFSILVLAVFAAVGVLVSSMTHRPAISLVALLLIWVAVTVMIPGLAKLAGEQAMTIPSSFELDRELETELDDIRRSHPDEAGNWNGDPFADNIPLRAAWVKDQLAAQQRSSDKHLNMCLAQAKLINDYSLASPVGVISSVFQRFAGTGMTGFETMVRKADQYRNQLYEFTKARDATDPDSPHLLYSWGESSDNGVFSRLPVEVSTVPRSWDLWSDTGVEQVQQYPIAELAILFLIFIGLVGLTIISFARYDPR